MLYTYFTLYIMYIQQYDVYVCWSIDVFIQFSYLKSIYLNDSYTYRNRPDKIYYCIAYARLQVTMRG